MFFWRCGKSVLILQPKSETIKYPNEGVLPDGQTVDLSELENDYVAQDE